MATQHLHIPCPSFVRGKRQHRYFDAPMEHLRSLMAKDQTTGYQVKGFELKYPVAMCVISITSGTEMWHRPGEGRLDGRVTGCRSSHRGDVIMLRNGWVFEYAGARLAVVAREKKEHHQRRLAWWNAKKNEVMESIRSDGLQISESESERACSSPTYGRRAHVLVKSDLQSRLDECTEKVRHHTAKVHDYDGWLQVLNANLEATLRLDFEDYLFFFGETSNREVGRPAG
jgi:hypothetical protein